VTETIGRLFGAGLKPPRVDGPYIAAEFRRSPKSPWMDIAGAGRGMQQVLLLFAILYADSNHLLLIDEPTAYLPPDLHGVVFGELRQAAEQQQAQLLIATHSPAVAEAAGSDLCQRLTAHGMKETSTAG